MFVLVVEVEGVALARNYDYSRTRSTGVVRQTCFVVDYRSCSSVLFFKVQIHVLSPRRH